MGGVTGEDLGQFAEGPEDLTDEAIHATEGRVNLRPTPMKPPGTRQTAAGWTWGEVRQYVSKWSGSDYSPSCPW